MDEPSNYQKYRATFDKYYSKPEIIEKRKIYCKNYYEENKEKLKEKMQEKYSFQRNEKITCSCGRTIIKKYLSNHLTRAYHINHHKELELELGCKE